MRTMITENLKGLPFSRADCFKNRVSDMFLPKNCNVSSDTSIVNADQIRIKMKHYK